MNLPSASSDEVLRARIGRAIAWLSGALLVVIFITTALLVGVTEPGIRAERERTFKQHSILITENLASALYLPGTGEYPQLEQDVFLAPTAAEFRDLLRQHSALISLTAVGEDLSVLNHAAATPRNVGNILAAFKTLSPKVFPPKDDEVSIVVEGNRLLTAGRVADGPGRGGPLLILEFEADSQFNPVRLMWLVVAFTLLTALLIWGALHHVLSVLVLRPMSSLGKFISRLHSGDWSDRIQFSGTQELQQFQDLTNKSVDRANRLWETIQWRAEHLERFDPSKRAEIRRIVEEAGGSYRFGTAQSPIGTELRVTGVACVGLALVIELTALFSVFGELGALTMAVASLDVPLPALLVLSTGGGYLIGQWLSKPAIDRVGFKVLAIVLQFVCAVAFAASSILATDEFVLVSLRAVAAVCAAALVSAWWHAGAAAVVQGKLSRDRLLLPGNPLALMLPFTPLLTTIVTTTSFEATFAVLSLTALIAALLSVFLPSSFLGLPNSSRDGSTVAPPKAAFAVGTLAFEALRITLAALAAAFVLDLSVNQPDFTIQYVGLCLVGVALAAGGLLPAGHSRNSIDIVALTAIVLTIPTGFALHYGTSLSPEILKVLSASSLCLMSACALAIPAPKSSSEAWNGRERPGSTVAATGYGLIGGAIIFGTGLINDVRPEVWVGASAACILIWRRMSIER